MCLVTAESSHMLPELEQEVHCTVGVSCLDGHYDYSYRHLAHLSSRQADTTRVRMKG